jgi:HAD superfamily hydrolase (TIGR01509 family)
MACLKGIFFDLDDTLLTSTPAMHAAIQAILPLLPDVTPQSLAEALKQSYHALWGFPGAGYAQLRTLPTLQLRQELTQQTLAALGVTDPTLHEELVRRYEAAERAALQPLPGASALLEALRPAFHLGIITNGPSIVQREKLQQVGLSPWFDVVVADSDFGAPKPDPQLFAYAAAQLGLEASELLFVGDSAEADVAGANAAGWISVYLGNSPCPEAAYTLTSLEEILTLEPVRQVQTTKRLASKPKVADTIH